jgi:sugar transferase (PEP-CTERM/EpsH1 system associated)
MKILWVTPRLPEPPDSGGKIVTFHTVKHLALRGHEITLCALIGKGPESKGPEDAYSPKLQEFADLRLVPSALGDGRNYPRMLISIFSNRPYVISKYWSEGAWRFIAQMLRGQSYEIMHCDHLHTAEYGLRAKEEFGLPLVLTAHNMETVLWEGVSHVERNWARRAYCRLQELKMRAYEAQTIASFDGCITLSAEDAKRMHLLNPEIRPVVVPPGVDIGYFQPGDVQEEPGSIIFVGAMDWLPNIEGILWFHRRVWPKVKRAIRGVKPKLYIVGGQPPRAIQRLANDRDVIVTGWVEDVRNYIAKAQVFIAPLRMGSGVRIKILNALAMGKAVVSTPLGCEGIRVNDGEDIWIANTAEEFAQKVVNLLENEAQRRRLGEAGMRLVRNYYRWEQTAEGIEKVYQQAMRDRAKTGIGAKAKL